MVYGVNQVYVMRRKALAVWLSLHHRYSQSHTTPLHRLMSWQSFMVLVWLPILLAALVCLAYLPH